MIMMGFCSSFNMMNLVFFSVPRNLQFNSVVYLVSYSPYDWVMVFFSFVVGMSLGRNERWMKVSEPPVSRSARFGGICFVSEPCICCSVLRLNSKCWLRSQLFFLLD